MPATADSVLGGHRASRLAVFGQRLIQHFCGRQGASSADTDADGQHERQEVLQRVFHSRSFHVTESRMVGPDSCKIKPLGDEYAAARMIRYR